MTKIMQNELSQSQCQQFRPENFLAAITDIETGEVTYTLPISQQVAWFRSKYPQGCIITEIMEHSEETATVMAKVFLDKSDPMPIATNTAQRFKRKGMYGLRFLDTAATAAIGRALSTAGFGIATCNIEPEKMAIPPEDKTVIEKPTVKSDVIEQEPTKPKRPLQVVSSNPMAETKVETEAEVEVENELPAEIKKAFEDDQASFETAKYTQKTPLAEILEVMTLDEAMNTTLTVGRGKGKKVKMLAQSDPESIDWVANIMASNSYNIDKAACLIVLKQCQKEEQKAS